MLKFFAKKLRTANYSGSYFSMSRTKGPNFWARVSSKYDRCRPGCCRQLLGQGVVKIRQVSSRVLSPTFGPGCRQNTTGVIQGAVATTFGPGCRQNTTGVIQGAVANFWARVSSKYDRCHPGCCRQLLGQVVVKIRQVSSRVLSPTFGPGCRQNTTGVIQGAVANFWARVSSKYDRCHPGCCRQLLGQGVVKIRQVSSRVLSPTFGPGCRQNTTGVIQGAVANFWARVSSKYDRCHPQGAVANFWARLSSKYDRCHPGCCRQLLGHRVSSKYDRCHPGCCRQLLGQVVVKIRQVSSRVLSPTFGPGCRQNTTGVIQGAVANFWARVSSKYDRCHPGCCRQLLGQGVVKIRQVSSRVLSPTFGPGCRQNTTGVIQGAVANFWARVSSKYDRCHPGCCRQLLGQGVVKIRQVSSRVLSPTFGPGCRQNTTGVIQGAVANFWARVSSKYDRCHPGCCRQLLGQGVVKIRQVSSRVLSPTFGPGCRQNTTGVIQGAVANFWARVSSKYDRCHPGCCRQLLGQGVVKIRQVSSRVLSPTFGPGCRQNTTGVIQGAVANFWARVSSKYDRCHPGCCRQLLGQGVVKIRQVSSRVLSPTFGPGCRQNTTGVIQGAVANFWARVSSKYDRCHPGCCRQLLGQGVVKIRQVSSRVLSPTFGPGCRQNTTGVIQGAVANFWARVSSKYDRCHPGCCRQLLGQGVVKIRQVSSRVLSPTFGPGCRQNTTGVIQGAVANFWARVSSKYDRCHPGCCRQLLGQGVVKIRQVSSRVLSPTFGPGCRQNTTGVIQGAVANFWARVSSKYDRCHPGCCRQLLGQGVVKIRQVSSRVLSPTFGPGCRQNTTGVIQGAVANFWARVSSKYDRCHPGCCRQLLGQGVVKIRQVSSRVLSPTFGPGCRQNTTGVIQGAVANFWARVSSKYDRCHPGCCRQLLGQGVVKIRQVSSRVLSPTFGPGCRQNTTGVIQGAVANFWARVSSKYDRCHPGCCRQLLGQGVVKIRQVSSRVLSPTFGPGCRQNTTGVIQGAVANFWARVSSKYDRCHPGCCRQLLGQGVVKIRQVSSRVLSPTFGPGCRQNTTGVIQGAVANFWARVSSKYDRCHPGCCRQLLGQGVVKIRQVSSRVLSPTFGPGCRQNTTGVIQGAVANFWARVSSKYDRCHPGCCRQLLGQGVVKIRQVSSRVLSPTFGPGCRQNTTGVIQGAVANFWARVSSKYDRCHPGCCRQLLGQGVVKIRQVSSRVLSPTFGPGSVVKIRQVSSRVLSPTFGPGCRQNTTGVIQGAVANFWARVSSKYDRCHPGCCRQLLGQEVSSRGAPRCCGELLGYGVVRVGVVHLEERMTCC